MVLIDKLPKKICRQHSSTTNIGQCEQAVWVRLCHATRNVGELDWAGLWSMDSYIYRTPWPVGRYGVCYWHLVKCVSCFVLCVQYVAAATGLRRCLQTGGGAQSTSAGKHKYQSAATENSSTDNISSLTCLRSRQYNSHWLMNWTNSKTSRKESNI